MSSIPVNPQPNAQPTRWRKCDWKEILTAPPEQNLYLINGVVMRRSGTLLSGLPHSMKSLSALAGCLEILVRGTFWGQQIHEPITSVAFIETEDPECLVHERIRELSKGLGITADNAPSGLHIFCPGRFALTDEAGQAELIQALNTCENPPQLIVLSTLQGMLTGGASWTKQEDMGPIMGFVSALCRQVCPVILLTHSPQDTSKQRAIGTVAQAANFAVLGHITKRIIRKADGSEETVGNAKFDSKIGGEFKLTMKLVTEGNEIRGFEYGTQASNQKRQDILDLHADEPDLTPEEIAERLACSARYVRKVLQAAKGRNS
jgi:DNA-binding CsgD family transcriptional regulator